MRNVQSERENSLDLALVWCRLHVVLHHATTARAAPVPRAIFSMASTKQACHRCESGVVPVASTGQSFAATNQLWLPRLAL